MPLPPYDTSALIRVFAKKSQTFFTGEKSLFPQTLPLTSARFSRPGVRFFPVQVVLPHDFVNSLPEQTLRISRTHFLNFSDVLQGIAGHQGKQERLLLLRERARLDLPIQVDIGAQHRFRDAEAARRFQQSRFAALRQIRGVLPAALPDLLRNHALLALRQVRPFRFVSHLFASSFSSQ